MTTLKMYRDKSGKFTRRSHAVKMKASIDYPQREWGEGCADCPVYHGLAWNYVLLILTGFAVIYFTVRGL